MNPRKPQHITMHPINHPQVVIAATPDNMSSNFVHNVYPSVPYFSRPYHDLHSSDYYSSAPSQKSSAGTGYESEIGSNVYPYGFSSYAGNHMYCPRCVRTYEPNAYHVGFHQQQQEEPQKLVQHDQYESVTASQQLLTSSNINLTTARPPMRRNSSDPNISKHKPSPCRPLDEQTRNIRLSSYSVV